MQGDPDQPVIVGRVYNNGHSAPHDVQKDPTKSTVRSQSAEVKREVDGFNEIRFEDKAKHEEIYLHAQRDLNEVVLGSHSTSVGGSQTNTVGKFRIHTVHDYETVTVFDDRTTLFKANEHHTVLGSRDTTIGINDNLTIGGWHNVKVAASESIDVDGKREIFVGQNQLVDVDSEHKLIAGTDHLFKSGGTFQSNAGVNFESNAGSNHIAKSTNAYFYPKGDFQVASTTAGFNQSSSFYVKAGSATLEMKSGTITLRNGAGAVISMVGGLVTISGASVVVKSDGPIDLGAGGDINGKAANIKLNG